MQRIPLFLQKARAKQLEKELEELEAWRVAKEASRERAIIETRRRRIAALYKTPKPKLTRNQYRSKKRSQLHHTNKKELAEYKRTLECDFGRWSFEGKKVPEKGVTPLTHPDQFTWLPLGPPSDFRDLGIVLQCGFGCASQRFPPEYEKFRK